MAASDRVEYAPSAALRIHLLGVFRVTYAGSEVPNPKRVQTLRVWAYLLLRSGETLARSAVCDSLWPEEESGRARFNLRHALHAINKLLPEPAKGTTWLISDRKSVAWNDKAGSWLDVAALAAARAAAESEPPSVDLEERLVNAEALYEGALLPSFDDPWVSLARDQAADDLSVVLERLLDLRAQRGQITAALETGRRLLQHDPSREAAHRAMMRLHVGRGDRAAALRQYEVLADRLQADFGVQPEAETHELAERIRKGEDLTQAAPGVATAPAPSAAWGTPRPSTLPYVDDLERRQAVMQLLEENRLVTLTGPGGIGKSRLAAEVMRTWAEGDERRMAWCALSDVAGESLGAAIGSAVGLAPAMVRGSQTRLAVAIAEAFGPHAGLLVLDGADDLLDPLVPWIERLRMASGSLIVLLTSREVLRVTGEARWPVPRLSMPDDVARLGLSRGPSESEQLLLGAVRAAAPGRVPTPAERPLATRICQALDGLPLAIVGVARRVAEAGVAAVAERTDEIAAEALSNALEAGWSRLSPAEQTLLRRFAIFPSSARLGDVEAVCADSDQADVAPIPRSARPDAGSDRVPPADVLDLVARLAGKSWLEVQSGRPFRYALLPTTRAWLLPRLEASGERAALRVALEELEAKEAEGSES